MSRVSPMRHASVALLVALAGCASPPTRELSIAQGAIDAARAAGAAEFAPDELRAAEATLGLAQTAVADRDHRAALGHALEAHLEAQAAAKAAAEGRVRARLAADERLDGLAAAIARLEAALAATEARRVPRAARRRAETTIADAQARLSAARDAVERHDPAAVAQLDSVMAALDAALAGLAPTPATRGRRR